MKKTHLVAIGVVIVVAIAAGIALQPREPIPNVKFVNNQKFSEEIYLKQPKTMNFVVIDNESVRYNDVKVVTTIENANDEFLSIQPKEITVEPLIGIEDSSERKIVTFTLNEIAQGGSLTYYGKSTLFVNGIETDHKDIELRVPKQ